MSDLGSQDELPSWLVDAILSEEPPPEDVDLVKQAFTWRTIDADLMELTYDSALDVAGVRDASGTRTMEFAAGEVSVVIEISPGQIRGVVATGALNSVNAIGLNELRVDGVVTDGRSFVLSVSPGTWRVDLTLGGDRSYSVGPFAVSRQS